MNNLLQNIESKLKKILITNDIQECIQKNNNELCKICKLDIHIDKCRFINCKHLYHKRCLKNWFMKIKIKKSGMADNPLYECPYCRKESIHIEDYNNNKFNKLHINMFLNNETICKATLKTKPWKLCTLKAIYNGYCLRHFKIHNKNKH